MSSVTKRGKLRAKFVPVTTGITGATDIEVLSGLNEGPGDRNRPLQDPARPQERLAGEAGYRQTCDHGLQRELLKERR